MRIAFVGAGEIAIRTSEALIEEGHEVIIIEKDSGLIESLSKRLDCSFLDGDGSNPEILKEVGPEQTDFLFCLSNSDQDNIIASLVGRSLGFKRVVPSIQNAAFEDICGELGLEDTIQPTRTISRYLADMVKGEDAVEMTTVLRGKARLFSFAAGEEEAGKVENLDLPDESRAICLYRDDELHLLDRDSSIHEEDQVVLLTTDDDLPGLREKWPPPAEDEGSTKRESN